MTGKEKCRLLRKIRSDIAVKNGFEPFEDTCTHQGECSGTCPKCEAEVKALSARLEARRARRKRVALAGVSIGVCTALTGCSADMVMDVIEHLAPNRNPPAQVEVLDGEIDIELDGAIVCPELEQ